MLYFGRKKKEKNVQNRDIFKKGKIFRPLRPFQPGGKRSRTETGTGKRRFQKHENRRYARGKGTEHRQQDFHSREQRFHSREQNF
ncbi:MAG: hypothetical protein LBL31_02165 [Spirochaetaceae bacterium]|nr:hypothetical protein [Spirochaetaceae bacterium]